MAENNERRRDAVCIETKQIYDSCKSKECLENLRVYLSEAGQSLADNATGVKLRDAEVIWVFTDVEPVEFSPGFYTVDLKYFFKVTLDVYSNTGGVRRIAGLSVFEKKIVLFGSEGNAKIFTSKFRRGEDDIQNWKKTNLPEAVVETVNPVVLSAKLVDCTCTSHCDCFDVDLANIPECICRVFDEALIKGGDGKRVYATLGMFTIVRLERETQLLVPSYDFCIPDNECEGAVESDPCELFENLGFPVDEFFPPAKCSFEKADGCCE
ncbi:MAG: hypothetical protein J5590_00285 [Clostridia bacterium]|nr:hypothetical protein [Clostridia bacterium]